MTKQMTDLTYTYKGRIDENVRPQDDFFAYVNRKWLADHPIPADETRWGQFNVLHDEAQKHVRSICENLQGKTFPAQTLEQQIRDFYDSGLHFDEHKAENRALVDLYFKKIDAAKQTNDLPRLFGELHKLGISSPWRLIIDADDMDSSRHIVRLRQTRLTLPDRDYYLDKGDKMRHIREQYEAHVRAMYGHFPGLAADEDTLWKTVWDFEEGFAQKSRTQSELRDIQKNYNNTSFAKLVSTYPKMDWQAYATALGWKHTNNISVDQPEFMTFLNELMTTKPLDDWKTYLKWIFLVEFGGKISEELALARFEFFGRVLGGATELTPLWKRVISTMNGAMGEGIGKLYAAQHFPEESKQRVLSLVEDVRQAYRERIQTLDWMSEATKETALRKLANIKVLIGYPDEWRDFTHLRITNDSYLANTIAAEEFSNNYWLDKLSKPTSRDDWFMYPQTVNAYHDPNRLVICFPGAILQAPFFSPQAPYAANIGGIGAIIGHEFTHGFDDQGCQFDEEGNVRTWQTDAERQAFAERAKIIIHQADEFEVLPGVHLKGDLVIGESIADLGGLELAHQALRNKIPDTSVEVTEELNAEEVFFISFASSECATTRDERKRQLALSDPHPIETFRVNGMVTHCDSFYDAFGVSPTDQLYRHPENRAHIW